MGAIDDKSLCGTVTGEVGRSPGGSLQQTGQQEVPGGRRHGEDQ